MKAKQVIALLLVLVLCVPLVANAASGDATVYITDTGSKYHRSSCGSLWNSSSAVTLQQALNWGYEPCQKCNPPAYIAAPTPSKTIEERIQAMRESAPEPTKTVQERINSLIEAGESNAPAATPKPKWTDGFTYEPVEAVAGIIGVGVLAVCIALYCFVESKLRHRKNSGKNRENNHGHNT